MYDVLSSLALACYEYLLVLGNEYNLLWRRKWVLLTWILFFSRYVTILVAVIQFAPYKRQVSLTHHESYPLHNALIVEVSRL